MLARDSRRLHHKHTDYEVIDVRYSMLPNRIDPLWGIRLDPAASGDAFSRFVTQRRLGDGDRERMLEMMFATDPSEGRPIKPGG